MSDTFERSLAHWSEARRAGMDAFYALATADYRVLAEAHDWAAWLREEEQRVARPLRLLDVACGSGKFPSALLAHGGIAAAGLKPITYDLLDPSAFSLAEARSVLAPPFVAGDGHQCTLQALDSPDGAFDVVWATHALYAVPPSEIDAALKRFVEVCGGRGVIAHAAERSHYIVFDRLYRAAFTDGSRTPYTTGEEIVSSFERLGVRVTVREREYVSAAPASAESAVEGFLQRCVFDDRHTLADMAQDERVGEYLARCRTDAGWRFPQAVKLIFIGV